MAENKMINVAEVGRKMDIRRISALRVNDVIAERVAGNVDLFKIMKGLFLEHRFTSMGHSREVLRDDMIEYMAKLKPGKSISLPVGFNLRLKKMRVKNDPDIISEIRGVFKDIVGTLIKIGGVGKGRGSKGRGSKGRGKVHGVGRKGRVKSKKNRVLGIAGKNGSRKNNSVRGVENKIVTRGPSLGMGGQFRAMANAQRLEHARMVESQRKFDALPCETKLQIAMNTIMDLEEELYESNKN